MDILFTGNLRLLSEKYYKTLAAEYRCVVFSESQKVTVKGKNIIYPKGYDTADQMMHVFSAFNFDTIVYFSYAIDGQRKVFDELEKLERTLYLCKEHSIKKFIYVTSNGVQMINNPDGPRDSHYILREACESLCKSFSETYGIQLSVLKIPYIFQAGEGDCILHSWAKDALKRNEINFPAFSDRQTDFVCDEDLGDLMARMIDDMGTETFRIIEVNGGNAMDFGRLGEVFAKVLPQVKINFFDVSANVPIHSNDKTARTDYGWFSLHSVESDLIEYIKYHQEKNRKSEESRPFVERFRLIQGTINKILEVIIGFFIAEIINYYTRDNVMINFIDFRLIYIILMGTINGMRAGVASALLATLGYTVASASTTPWQILFYNIENWLPFACYFLLGTVTGYTSDKHNDYIEYEKEEYEILEEKYTFLSDLYANVLDSKEEFNSQIIAYKDSFGKIYSVVKKLDSKLPEEVLFEAIRALEDTLNNYTVAIYTLNENNSFARQQVCSKNCVGRLPKSLDVSQFPEILEKIQKREIFVNTKALKGYPAYVNPIYQDGRLYGIVVLLEVQYHDMNMEFMNKFRIITDLISSSLVRAIEQFEINGRSVEGTRILSNIQFDQVYRMKKEMRKKQYLDYTLVQIKQEGRDLIELATAICSVIRDSDVIGLGQHNELMLILAQSGKDDIDVVAQRLKNKGISFSIIEG